MPGSCQETETRMVWHVTRQDSLSKTILRRTLEGGRHCGRQKKKCWTVHVKEWTSLPMPELLMMASSRKVWKTTSAESALPSLLRQPDRLRD